jgi:N utilization substance protein B
VKARRAARRLALDVLYEAEIRDELPSEAWEARRTGGWVVATAGDSEQPVPDEPSEEALDYASELVKGVQSHHADIDELIAAHADRWAIERMPVVDRTLLRMALFELLWRDDIPVAVGINEAVELAKSYSTEDSGRFINGLLGRIVEVEKGA